MPTKKKAGQRRSQSQRKMQSHVQSATIDATSATIHAQFAFLESQIALLQAQNAELRAERKDQSQVQSSTFKVQSEDANEKHSEIGSCAGGNSTLNSALPKAAPPADNSTATFLQTWLDELQIMFDNFSEIVPELSNTVLDTTDRRRLLGSGVRRYGFIEKTVDVAGEFPQFWPSFVTDGEKLKELVHEIEVLRNLLVWFRYASRIVGDLLLVAGDDAFRLAGSYYATARDGARRQIPEAVQVFQMLQLFWRRRRRTSSSDEPTMHELERNFHGVLHGTKDGTVSAHHESPTSSGGVHEVIDNVHSAKCRTSAKCKTQSEE